jgi:hypothetical protein
MWRWGPPAFVALAAMVALTALTADAAARQARSAPTETTAQREAGEPIMAIVSIETQQVTFYDSEGWILRAPVSTGTTGRETPAGVFIEKDKDHHSTLYDDAWMPNMQRITWNGIALHGGRCRGMRPRTAACGCPTSLRRTCSTRPGSGCGLSSRRNSGIDRMNRATRATRCLNLNLIRALARS